MGARRRRKIIKGKGIGVGERGGEGAIRNLAKIFTKIRPEYNTVHEKEGLLTSQIRIIRK